MAQIDKARWQRQNMTTLEKKVWKLLGGEENGWGFLRQMPVGVFIADFVSFAHNLVIEADGPDHIWTTVADIRRDAEIRKLGFATIRLTPAFLGLHHASEIYAMIDDAVRAQHEDDAETVETTR